MVLEIPRRRFMRTINSKYIYGKFVSLSGPTADVAQSRCVTSSIVLCGQTLDPSANYRSIAPIAYHHLLSGDGDDFEASSEVQQLLWRTTRYTDPTSQCDVCVSNNYLVLTMMITNAVLGGIADTVAQSITAIRLGALRKPGGITKDDTMAIEIHELDRKNPFAREELIPDSKALPPPFDFERLTRFMAYGFMMAPVQFKWFQFLSRAFPMTKSSSFGPAMRMVALDQLIFAPFGIACFFTVMTIAEGGGRRAVTHKLRDMYIPTLKANFMVWPLVQIINFRLMPIQFQLPFVSSVGIAWTAYLSLSNAAEDVDARSAPQSPNIRLS
ncbi:uncharacterized protein BP5553_01884 [Venustampulla echinocandica]|uniref:Uncharacterized protein n=1 Tax=Venustampulla echinocandica TaxID=2656787 RepID=A0A370U2C4_9HELO|nr:uncharacterized protein BP5553_01884 [Venustampulla echinocandica]RDL41905.1 hypothetical protein BP5553_01884 [Venustampulla echinocandica]